MHAFIYKDITGPLKFREKKRYVLDNLYTSSMSHTPKQHMVTSSNGNIFRVTGHLCGEFTGPRRIPRTKVSDAELWCFLWSASE